MNYGFPDWMFAAIAIAAWEFTEYLYRQWHVPYARFAGYVVIGVCALALVIRYIVRFVRRPRHQEEPDPDEWKNY